MLNIVYTRHYTITDTMTLTQSIEAVLRWVYTEAKGGRRYFKTRHITSDTGISPQAAAHGVRRLSTHGIIGKWRYSGSPVTWEITIDRGQSD